MSKLDKILTSIKTFAVAKPIAATVVGVITASVVATGTVVTYKHFNNDKAIIQTVEKTTKKDDIVVKDTTTENKEEPKKVEDTQAAKQEEKKKEEPNKNAVKVNDSKKSETKSNAKNISSQNKSNSSSQEKNKQVPTKQPSTTVSKPKVQAVQPRPAQPKQTKPTRPSGVNVQITNEVYNKIKFNDTNTRTELVSTLTPKLEAMFSKGCSESSIKSFMSGFSYKFYNAKGVLDMIYISKSKVSGENPTADQIINSIPGLGQRGYIFIKVIYDANTNTNTVWYASASPSI